MISKLHPNLLISPCRNVLKASFIAFFLLMVFSNSGKAQTGRTLSFDGVNDYISLPVGLSGSYTKEAWLNASDLTGFRNMISGTGTAFFLDAGRLAAGHAPGFAQALDPVTLIAGTWYHVAVTYNAVTGDMLLYKNGILVFTAPGVSTYTEPLLEISRFGGANFFNGRLDEVRLWNRVRTAVEINSNMN
ncbi:MAG: LamG domain-containing protein, partial [Sphingobacteriales bacterium]